MFQNHTIPGETFYDNLRSKSTIYAPSHTYNAAISTIGQLKNTERRTHGPDHHAPLENHHSDIFRKHFMWENCGKTTDAIIN